MKCPIDNTTLTMSERQGIEIDYCPECRGVWLDRGELDRLIERAAAEETRSGGSGREDLESRERREDSRMRDPDPKKKKKSSFLSEIFEFGG